MVPTWLRVAVSIVGALAAIATFVAMLAFPSAGGFGLTVLALCLVVAIVGRRRPGIALCVGITGCVPLFFWGAVAGVGGLGDCGTGCQERHAALAASIDPYAYILVALGAALLLVFFAAGAAVIFGPRPQPYEPPAAPLPRAQVVVGDGGRDTSRDGAGAP